MRPRELRIFISSTSVDLAEARQRIIRLLSAIPAELIHMETFGSDETRSVDYSLAQVRECNLFVGIYAERYGTVDTRTGRSITELEYRTAQEMLQEGQLIGLLVYVLDPRATWKVEHIDRSDVNVNALTRLKEHLKKNHTVTFFNDIDDLALDVLRDTLRKIDIGVLEAFRPRKALPVISIRRAGPLGMEHYTEADVSTFRGRENDVAAMSELITNHPLSLLIGDSGIGKTSLIQAGVFPKLRETGWATVWTRPLEEPDRSIPTAVWHRLMTGLPPSISVSTVLQLVATAYGGRNVLIVIDQLEDVISQLGSPKLTNLVDALTHIYHAPPSNLRIVLCYRGDVEPKFGKYWQTISGSASGLPRYYLNPLTEEGANRALSELFLSQNTPNGTELKLLISAIVSDVGTESARSLGAEIYPPFLQMVAETLSKAATKTQKPLSNILYESLGRAEEIIGRYLVNQLQLLGVRAKESRSILISLASRERRLRKSVDEIAQETEISSETAESCLHDLTNLRLVRPIDDTWEIVHDFLAKKVMEDLVAPEEREARIFRDVLVAKAAAFASTGELLTFKEHLGILANRSRITCTPDEVELLFASSLVGNGPVDYFLGKVSPELPIAWAERRLKAEDLPVRRNAYRFLLKHGKSFKLEVLAEVFSDYVIQAELAKLIERFAVKEDLALLLRLRRKKAELVREAADKKIESLTDGADDSLLTRLLSTNRSEDVRLVSRILTTKSSRSLLPEYRASIRASSLRERARGICGIGAKGIWSDAKQLLDRLEKRKLRPKEQTIYGYSLALWARRHKRRSLVKSLLTGKRTICRGALLALENDRVGIGIRILLEQHKSFPVETSAVVRHTAVRGDIRELKQFLKTADLDQPVRDVVLGLLHAGSGREAKYVLKLIGSKEYEVHFWNVPVVVKVMSQAVDSSVKTWFMTMAESDEFWEYFGTTRGKHPLPVKAHDNLYLFKRLVAVPLASLCGKQDWPLLKRLVFHQYWLMQAAAAESIRRFGGRREFDELITQARVVAGEKANAGVVFALQLLDEKLWADWDAAIRSGQTSQANTPGGLIS